MRVFRDYAEIDPSALVGYRISKVDLGINYEDSGISIELEREIEGGVIGIEICYDPSEESEDAPFSISEEYIKHVFDKK